MKSNKPKNKTRRVGFTNKVHVRNQYETPSPDGVNVNFNDYNVNEDPLNSSGYPLTSSKYVPHSKSSLVRAMRKMGTNVGWGPALSSVGTSNLSPNKLRKSMENRNNMKAQYGNKWVEAEAVRNNSQRALEEAVKEATDLYNKDMAVLETNFVSETGIMSPSELNRKVKEEINEIQADFDSNLIKEEVAVERVNDIYARADAIGDTMPSKKRDEYMKAWGDLKTKLKGQLKDAKNLLTPYTSLTMGTPYPKVNTNFTKRLRNSKKRGQNFINGK